MMNKGEDKAFQRMMRDIYATEGNEIHCEQAAVEMVRATAQPLSETELTQQYLQLTTHLQLCVDCAAEYGLLRQVVADEVDGEATVVGHIPPVPDRPKLTDRLFGAVTAVFEGFKLASPIAVTRGGTLGIDPVDVDLPAGELAVSLDVDVNEHEEAKRNLFVTVMPRAEMTMDGVTMELRTAAQGHILAEATLDALGDGVFLQIPPGNYDLIWQMMGKMFVIEQVTLP